MFAEFRYTDVQNLPQFIKKENSLLSKDTAYCKYFLKRLPIGVIYLEYANLCMYLIGKRFV